MSKDQNDSKQNDISGGKISIQGNTNIVEGDVVGRDKIVFTLDRNALVTYLNTIIRDEDQLAQRYISLSGYTKKEHAAPTEWPRGLMPTAFKVIDKQLKSDEIEPPVLLDTIEDALKIHSQFVLLGDPGAGKTTTLKKLQLDQAQRALENKNQRIPILIHLSEWADDIRDVPSLILHQQKLQGIPNIHFNQMLILFDGLNEMDTEKYEKRLKWIDEWLRANSSVSIIVSCRTNVYVQGKQLFIASVQIDQLDEVRIQQFLHAYLGEKDGDILLQSLKPEKPNIQSKRDLIHLATNPFLLSMISYVYIQKGKNLPSNRG